MTLTRDELFQMGVTQWCVLSRYASDFDEILTYEGTLTGCIASANAQNERTSELCYALIIPYNGKSKHWDADSSEVMIIRGRAMWDAWFTALRSTYENARVITGFFNPDAPVVLPFDDTPLPLSIEQQIDAAIAKHALAVEIDCDNDDDDDDDDNDDDDDYYASADYLEEMESEIEAWRDFAVKLTNAPRCMVETPYEAQSWLDLKGLIK